MGWVQRVRLADPFDCLQTLDLKFGKLFQRSHHKNVDTQSMRIRDIFRNRQDVS
jgi:hypothetical protein